MYVDINKRSFDRRTGTRSGTGRAFEETRNVHHALHELRSVRVRSSIMNGCRQGQLSSRRRGDF